MRLKINSCVLHLSNNLGNYFGKFLLYMGYNQYDHYITKNNGTYCLKTPVLYNTLYLFFTSLSTKPTQIISSNEKADKNYIAQKSCS